MHHSSSLGFFGEYLAAQMLPGPKTNMQLFPLVWLLMSLFSSWWKIPRGERGKRKGDCWEGVKGSEWWGGGWDWEVGSSCHFLSLHPHPATAPNWTLYRVLSVQLVCSHREAATAGGLQCLARSLFGEFDLIYKRKQMHVPYFSLGPFSFFCFCFCFLLLILSEVKFLWLLKPSPLLTVRLRWGQNSCNSRTCQPESDRRKPITQGCSLIVEIIFPWCNEPFRTFWKKNQQQIHLSV